MNIYGKQCDFMQKNQKKHSKNKITHYVNSAPELINDQKTAKTVYFGLYLVNPRVQAAQNMCAKGGWRVF